MQLANEALAELVFKYMDGKYFIGNSCEEYVRNSLNHEILFMERWLMNMAQIAGGESLHLIFESHKTSVWFEQIKIGYLSDSLNEQVQMWRFEGKNLMAVATHVRGAGLGFEMQIHVLEMLD